MSIATPPRPPSTTLFGHAILVVEENHNYGDVVGSSAMPYLNSLINQFGLATQYYADTHPSIGNYFMLTTGQILTNDDSQTPSSFPVSVDNVVRQLLAAGTIQLAGEERIHGGVARRYRYVVELDRTERHLREGDVEAARRAISSARAVLEAATDRTRRLTFELRPQLLDAAGLGAAVRDIADGLARDTDANVTVRTRLTRQPAMIETLAYRTIREALINVRKHAHAKNVSIRVTERRGELVAVIRDDGRGFTPGRRSATSTHFGVDSARERVMAAGGSFEISSVRGQGTTVEFRIPLPSGHGVTIRE